MAILDIFKISRKTFFNPRGWLDYDSLKVQNRTIWQVIRANFSVAKPRREETFEAAVQRLKLNEADIHESIRQYHLYASLFLAIGLVVFIYSFYVLFLYAVLSGFLLGLVSAGLLLSQAFKYSFWACQMKKRRLGVTLMEWKRDLLGDKKGSAS
ncbi:MAG TPA: hypothetical protein VHZ76_02890 [Gammaproteobacteria bacterium]|jgi:hypothetical protein|nr:hypothetical protein [Gammaproteobacteria bacterium]